MDMPETVSLTGTPGTGKTTVAKIIGEKTDYRVVDVNKVAESGEVEYTEDRERGSLAVDVGQLADALEQRIDGKTLFEGHLSHYFEPDLVVVLRCHPEELEKRLEEKGWNDKKIHENVESEVVDVVLQEAVTFNEGKVAEIDTSGKNPEEVAETIIKIINGDEKLENFSPGQVDWAEDYW